MTDPMHVFELKGPQAEAVAEKMAQQLALYGNAYFTLPGMDDSNRLQRIRPRPSSPRLVLVKPCAFPYAHTLHDWHTLPGRKGKMFRCTGTRTAPSRGRHLAPEPRWVRTFSILAVAVVLTVVGVAAALLRAW